MTAQCQIGSDGRDAFRGRRFWSDDADEHETDLDVSVSGEEEEGDLSTGNGATFAQSTGNGATLAQQKSAKRCPWGVVWGSFAGCLGGYLGDFRGLFFLYLSYIFPIVFLWFSLLVFQCFPTVFYYLSHRLPSVHFHRGPRAVVG